VNDWDARDEGQRETKTDCSPYAVLSLLMGALSPMKAAAVNLGLSLNFAVLSYADVNIGNSAKLIR
jgi:hypothetical protein